MSACSARCVPLSHPPVVVWQAAERHGTVTAMHPQDYERQQLERFRRACESELRRDERQRRFQRRVWLALGLFALGGGAALSCFARSPEGPVPSVEADSPPEMWATDGEADAGPIARPMPAKPFEGQKKAPCEREEVTIRGGCWEELARRPVAGSCGPKAFEHEDRCYIPVKQAKRPPTSVEP